MFSDLKTERLSLRSLELTHGKFIYELVNTVGWIMFIGNRNIQSVQNAKAYIEKIQSNPNVTYWVVHENTTLLPIGVVTYIQRDYLPYRDIGFAFLPQFCGKGFAKESTSEVINYIKNNHIAPVIFATTKENNVNSIHLLNSLQFNFSRKIELANERLQLFERQLLDEK